VITNYLLSRVITLLLLYSLIFLQKRTVLLVIIGLYSQIALEKAFNMVKLEIFSLLLLTVIISFLFGYQLFTDREKKQAKSDEVKSKSVLDINDKLVVPSSPINQMTTEKQINQMTPKISTEKIKTAATSTSIAAAAALALAPSLNNAPHLKFNPKLCPNATMFGRPHRLEYNSCCHLLMNFTVYDYNHDIINDCSCEDYDDYVTDDCEYKYPK
jgi:hypothetical protein